MGEIIGVSIFLSVVALRVLALEIQKNKRDRLDKLKEQAITEKLGIELEDFAALRYTKTRYDIEPVFRAYLDPMVYGTRTKLAYLGHNCIWLIETKEGLSEVLFKEDTTHIIAVKKVIEPVENLENKAVKPTKLEK